MNSRLPVARSRARRIVAALVVVLTLSAGSLGAAAPAAAEGDGNGSPTNDAIAINTKDGSSVFKLAFNIRTITSSTVAPQNAAVAYASCQSCQTVAIAVQIIFVIGSPTVFTPENVAIAVNDQCSFCDTLASAYQFVVQSSVPVQLTHEGKKELHDIFKALQDLDGSGLDSFALQAEIDKLMAQLANVLATQVEPIPGEDHNGDGQDGASSAVTTVSTTTTTSTSTSTTTSTSTSTTTTTTTTPASS
jgi:putative peptide zinc metalloprotease protein